VQACEACRTLSMKFPDHKEEISRHCDEIERLMHESGELQIGGE